MDQQMFQVHHPCPTGLIERQTNRDDNETFKWQQSVRGELYDKQKSADVGYLNFKRLLRYCLYSKGD